MSVKNASFLSTENKAMIWQLLTDNDAFKDIPNTYLSKVTELYEKAFEKISNIKSISLVQRNKLTIAEMMKNLSYFKTSNISKPLEEVQIKLDKDYEQKQAEFIQLIKRPTPEEVKFEDTDDKNDKPLDIKEMDSMLSKMMKQRENELNQIQQENPQIDDKQPSHNGHCVDYMWSQFGKSSNNKKLLLESIEKKVTFNDINDINDITDTNDTNDSVDDDEFITKLKKLNVNKNIKQELSIDDKLSKLLVNQEKILQLLNN